MTRKTQALPYGISEYITNHFKDDFLFDVKSVKQLRGHTYYTVEVTKDDHIHYLYFNEHGALVDKEEQEAFPPDSHEEIRGDIIPE